VFGRRPPRYFEEIARVDSSVRLFWTGEKICSEEYSREHLERVARELGRKPLLWDNYPVNDGQRMHRHLHLSPVTGRGPELRELTEGVAVNPMNQARLSWIPIRTLFAALGSSKSAPYVPERAWDEAARSELGGALAEALKADRERFHRA